MALFGRIFCLFGQHRPKRRTIRTAWTGWIAYCSGCNAIIIKPRLGKWRIARLSEIREIERLRAFDKPSSEQASAEIS